MNDTTWSNVKSFEKIRLQIYKKSKIKIIFILRKNSTIIVMN